MSTIYDIAKQADVSPATVSKVINRRGGVGEQTAEHVNRIMLENNFQPRYKASRCKSVGVVIFPHTNCLAGPYSGQVLSAVSETLFTEGYTVQLIPHHHTDTAMHDLRQLVSSHLLEGVVVLANRQTYETAERIECSGIPHVVIEGPSFIAAEHRISAADFAAGKQAGEYLWSLGHRSIAVVTPLLENVSHDKRFKGILKAVEEAGGDPTGVVHRQYPHMTFGQSAATELMSCPNHPTAVVITNSELAIGFARGCKALGLNIPGDVSLLGFEDGRELENIDPPMTAMRMLTRRMGQQAAKVLMNQIMGASFESPPLFEMTLLARATTAPPNSGSTSAGGAGVPPAIELKPG